MAGIKVPQHEVFKIGTEKLAYSNWDITISKDEAYLTNEIVALFQGQEFRHIYNILCERNEIANIPITQVDFTKYICSIVIEKMGHFNRATSKTGIKINGNTYRRFVGTTGGLKNNTLLLVNIDVIDELNKRCECGRNKNIPLVPAKYEAYKALSCSASQPIINPNRILVVKDCVTKFVDSIISLNNSDPDFDSPAREFIENAEIENTISDGFNLCTYDYMQRVSESLGLDYVTDGVCLRNAWLKGMLYAFPIIEFVEKYHKDENGDVDYFIKDIWGDYQDIRKCDMIITESSLKLWSAYDSIDHYMKSYKENGYTFAVTKISPHKLDDERELNYQYIQSYDLSNEDISELCDPTIVKLKDALCGDYDNTIKFIGGSSDMEFSWQKALTLNPYMLKDPYVIDCVHKMIKKKIDMAKIGKLIVNGNYQIASGDPFMLMQSICGIEPTGLLKANECYSNYWNLKNEQEIVVFRSPMTCHNNIRKCTLVNNDNVNYWYQYMKNIMVINGWDSFCQAENGCDWDGDILFSTNNKVLIRKHRVLPAIVCAQSNTSKVIINEKEIKKTNKNGMGNQVGTITNRVTGMIEVQSRYPKESPEWEELEYRIECGQLYQQDEIDKIKGIKSRPMPNYWYSPKSCDGDDFKRSIVLDKKPYFMIYVYDDYKKKMKAYESAANQECQDKFGYNIEELLKIESPDEKQQEFIYWYEKKSPFGRGPCSMNKICWYVEAQMNGHKNQLKRNSDFNYSILKVKRRCTNEHREQLEKLSQQYISMVRKYKYEKTRRNPLEETVFLEDEENKVGSRQMLASYFKRQAEEICPDDNERLNIILDMCYQYRNNMQFCWDVIGELICKRLEELNNAENTIK